jgi:hypothetical protein
MSSAAVDECSAFLKKQLLRRRSSDGLTLRLERDGLMREQQMAMAHQTCLSKDVRNGSQ